ncbi:hypothetical protein [Janthinobacterium sp. PC23-8]|uniref:hypothetical protein n=1 Tax=Janthinobacterium sp. PC23-8 TaxID=2012679 RepID=UPI00113FE2D6|nr:hypothetical protein [Janthinobacterium sp. PC23-8]
MIVQIVASLVVHAVSFHCRVDELTEPQLCATADSPVNRGHDKTAICCKKHDLAALSLLTVGPGRSSHDYRKKHQYIYSFIRKKMANKDHREELVHLLAQRPATAPALAAALDISQPTFSRLWRTITDGVALGAGMASQFWTDVLNDERISSRFKIDVARPHLAAVQALRSASGWCRALAQPARPRRPWP